jgi:hypothetical protein
MAQMKTAQERLPAPFPGVELARTADLLVRILDHFLPLRDPADGAREREEHGEHRGREAHRLQDDARVEVDVRDRASSR